VKNILFLLAIGLIILSGCVQNPPVPDNPDDQGGDEMGQKIERGDYITVNYRGTLEDGTEFDSSLKAGREPLGFTVGAGEMIAGFDEAVVGMKIGDEKNVSLSPEKAYGNSQEDQIVTVPRENLSQLPDEQIYVGAKLRAQNGAVGTVIEVTEENVKIDFNHELAGKTLKFWIKIVTIEKDGA